MTIYTVGSGGDFAHWGTAYFYLCRTIKTLVDNIDFVQISDCTVNSWVTYINVANPNWFHSNGFTVRFICPLANSHFGDPTKGYKTYLASMAPDANNFRIMGHNEITGDGRIFVENLNMICTQSGAYIMMNPGNWEASAGLEYTKVYIKNLLLKGKTTSAPGTTGLQISHNLDMIYASNIKIWNCLNGISEFQGQHVITDIKTFYENITVYNCKYGITPDSIHWRFRSSFKNIVSMKGSAGGYAWYDSGGHGIHTLNNCIYSNCADDDGSLQVGTDIKNNIDNTDEFESLLDVDSDFLNLKKIDAFIKISGKPISGVAPHLVKFDDYIKYSAIGKDLADSGMVPVLETNDIADKKYGEFGFYPIGCHNSQSNVIDDVWEI